MTSPTPRQDLALALADAAGGPLTVFSEEPATAPGLPALVVRPGAPYRSESASPVLFPCRERWRLEIVALVPIDAVLPLDDLDVLIELARDVVRATPNATWNGVRQAPGQMTISGKPHHGAIVELDVET